MTNDEAISILEDEAYFLYEDDDPYDREAFHAAVAALKAQKHGHWKRTPTGWVYCSVCGQEPPNETNIETKYCPNCGSLMDMEATE